MRNYPGRLASTLAFVAATVVSAQEWPSFRGPGASGIADGRNAPTSWNARTGENVLWKTAIPGLGHSSPIVSGDRIFLTTAVSLDPEAIFVHGLDGRIDRRTDVARQTWHVIALDAKTGAILWDRVAHESEPRIQRHPKNSYASATPATDGKRVVAWFGSEGLYCYDFEGRLLWKKDLGTVDAGASYDVTYRWGAASSPILYRNRVIVLADQQKDSFLAAFDVETGEPVWRVPRNVISSFSTPTVYEGGTRPELVTNGAETIHGYDPLTGRELWQLRGSSKNTTPTPVAAHELLYVASGYRVNPIFAIRPGGSGDISLAGGETKSGSVEWSTARDGPYMATPLVYQDFLYTCSFNGVLACYRAKTGELVYRERIGGVGGAYSASPVAADGRIYLASEEGDVYVIRAGERYEVLAVNPMGEVLMATPAISEGRMFVRTERHLYAVGKKSND